MLKDSLGGWVESEFNLSQNGNCWIYNEAKVMDSAAVSDNAEVEWECIVRGNAKVYGNAKIRDNAIISDSAEAFGNCSIYNNAVAANNSKIFGNCQVYGNSRVESSGRICGSAQILEDSISRGDIFGSVIIRNASVIPTIIEEGSRIFGRGMFLGCTIGRGSIVNGYGSEYWLLNLYDREYISSSTLPLHSLFT